MNEFVNNIIENSVSVVSKLKLRKYYKNRNIVIVSDEHEISYSLCGVLTKMQEKSPAISLNFVINQKPEHPEFLEELCSQWPEIKVWNSLDSYMSSENEETEEKDSGQINSKKGSLFFVFANLRSQRYDDDKKKQEKENQLRCLLDDLSLHIDNKLFLITAIPSIKEPLPSVTNAIAEREYEVIFRDYPDNSPEKFVIQLENVIRSYSDIAERVKVIRLDRVFGPGITDNEDLWVMDILHDIFDDAHVTLSDNDRHDFASAVYIKDALVQIILACGKGKKGNIYHVSSWELSRFQVVELLLDSFPDTTCRLDTVNEDSEGTGFLKYRILNARKLRTLYSRTLEKYIRSRKLLSLKATAFWYLDKKDYVPENNINVYFGRMDRIRELELEILKDVDRICKENGINYFISAGTMLGAIRHQSFIPWDDDVDIGMLPEDYEKFLQICPGKLSNDYGYQNYSTEETSHYIHDKIRLKNSYFSTRYSHARPMMNGVYIDIFVYYKTSDNPLLQKLHIKHIQLVRKFIGLRWALRKRKSKYGFLFTAAFKIIKKIPFSWFHKYYMHVLKLYESKDTHYRLDSTGFNLKKVGAVPDEWFHGTVEKDFCGYRFPVLEHYDEFLSHWFGENYMDLLPVSKRKSNHDVVRIDLGQFLFDETMHDPRFRDVDLRGELFEQLNSEKEF